MLDYQIKVSKNETESDNSSYTNSPSLSNSQKSISNK